VGGSELTPRGAARLAAFAILILPAVLQPAAGLTVVFSPERARPGDVVLVHVKAAPADLEGELGAAPLRFFPVRDGVAALAGVDLDVVPGPVRWRLTRPMATGGRLVVGTGSVRIHPRAFDTQRLTLPPGQVDLDAETLARVKAERAEMEGALAGTAPERLWREAFRTPIDDGRPTGGFGLRRIINNQPRSPHTGYDWAAPVGTPVLAANAGRVALVARHFFAGQLVVLDHGLGLVTLYFHLDEPRVATGDVVTRGQTLGTVGATGRVTGPHLHFGVLLGGARVDPIALLAIEPPPAGP
jgi:murein DD-endopeptidase MepM/ murein hydrolase activator NlpD